MTQRVDVQYVQFYTNGNTARRMAPAASVSTGTLPRLRKKKRIMVYVDPVAILGIAVAVVMLITMTVGLVHLQRVQNQTVQMEQYVEVLRQEHASLQQTYSDACDLEAVEKTALALGMIPMEQARQTTLILPAVQTEDPEPVGLWNQIGTFLSGLFA